MLRKIAQRPRILFFASVFVVPYAVIALPGVPHWLGRALAAAIFVLAMTVSIFWYGLSPNSKMIGASGKFNQPQFAEVRPKIVRGMRILVVAFGLVFCLYFTLPVTSDLIQLAATKKPARITGTAVYKSVPLLGVWFLNQSVRLSRGGKSYQLFYSWRPLRVGETYEFIVLPRSRFILDFREPP